MLAAPRLESGLQRFPGVGLRFLDRILASPVPLARKAAMAEASVQPEPWYSPASLGQRSSRSTPPAP